VDGVKSVEGVEEGKPVDGEFWNSFLNQIKPFNHSIFALLQDTAPKSIEKDKIVLAVRFRFYTERLYDRKNREIIEKVLSELSGRPMRIECEIDENVPKPQSIKDEELMQSVAETFGIENN
jgi:hypothetical protein